MGSGSTGGWERLRHVLPFVNMSDDNDYQYFSDGISEEVLNAMVWVEGLGVASRTSLIAYNGRVLSGSQIASALKVRYILEGSIRTSAKEVHITAQLIDASNDRHSWSETLDREVTDIFKIQDEIAKAIVVALRGTLGAAMPALAVGDQADTEAGVPNYWREHGFPPQCRPVGGKDFVCDEMLT